jgi:uncharacterized protein
MATYKTPGVYVEEISMLPPSVAEVATAIPAFIGYTQIGPTRDAQGGVMPTVARINTLLEYRSLFGSANASGFTATTSPDPADPKAQLRKLDGVSRDAPAYEFSLYYSVSLYFQNGGGSCYIISVGNYNDVPSAADFKAGLDALEKEDEPTLILLSDAVNLLGATDYYTLCVQALGQCDKLGDRFAILDVQPSDTNDKAIQAFRDAIGNNYLSYGAAYHPYVLTTLSYDYAEARVEIKPAEAFIGTWQKQTGDNGLTVSYKGKLTDAPKVKIVAGKARDAIQFAISPQKLLTITVPSDQTGADVADAWVGPKNTVAPQGFEIVKAGTGADKPEPTDDDGENLVLQTPTATTALALVDMRSDNTALYNQIKAAIAQHRVVLPPSAAIAGVYASVDRERGVWKAPANVSLAAVIGPVAKITNTEQDTLNIDATGGLSINAIRAFTGKGTLVWGARTLAGNDNEWRYVPVRRLFIMIEESVQKASAFAVFEPNDATTWLKVKAMIESYLYGLWEQGALAGPTPQAAYFVQVGLGKTMTPQDVLEGRMIVEIGIAAVRPAEFIILRFMHKLQEA